MLFYLLGDIERLIALDDNEYLYVREGDHVLIQSQDDSPHGDNQLASPRNIQDIFNALNDGSCADCLVLIATDTAQFEYYPLSYLTYQDPYTGGQVLYDSPERMELRARLTDLVSNSFFRYGNI